MAYSIAKFSVGISIPASPTNNYTIQYTAHDNKGTPIKLAGYDGTYQSKPTQIFNQSGLYAPMDGYISISVTNDSNKSTKYYYYVSGTTYKGPDPTTDFDGWKSVKNGDTIPIILA